MSTVNKKILRFLARKIVKKYHPRVIGVVGETEEIISRVLSSKFSTRNSGNFFDNETNVLLAVIGIDCQMGANLPDGGIVSTVKIFMEALKLILTKQEYPEFLVLEIKSDQTGGVKSLFKIARPEIGIIIGAEKLSNSKQSIKEKNLLVKHLRKNELAILNRDDKLVGNVIWGTRAKIITFGFSEKAMVRATEVINEKEIGNWKLETKKSDYLDGNLYYERLKEKKGEVVSFKINYQNTFIPIRLTRRQIYPALAAAAVGLNYGLNLVEIVEMLGGQE